MEMHSLNGSYERPGSFRLDVREIYHLRPLLGIIGNELTEVRGRTHKDRRAQVSKPRLHLRLCKSRVDCLVQLFDDVGGGVFWRTDTLPAARLVAQHKLAHR